LCLSHECGVIFNSIYNIHLLKDHDGDFVGINNKQAEREGEKLTTPIGMRSIFEIHIIPGSTAHH
jgi:hypothetical protein